MRTPGRRTQPSPASAIQTSKAFRTLENGTSRRGRGNHGLRYARHGVPPLQYVPYGREQLTAGHCGTRLVSVRIAAQPGLRRIEIFNVDISTRRRQCPPARKARRLSPWRRGISGDEMHADGRARRLISEISGPVAECGPASAGRADFSASPTSPARRLQRGAAIDKKWSAHAGRMEGRSAPRPLAWARPSRLRAARAVAVRPGSCHRRT